MMKLTSKSEEYGKSALRIFKKYQDNYAVDICNYFIDEYKSSNERPTEYYDIFEKKKGKYNILLTTIEIVDHSKKLYGQFLNIEETKDELNSDLSGSESNLDAIYSQVN